MTGIDQYIIDFVSGSTMTLSALFGILVGLAKISPWTWDEKVLDTIIAPFKTILDSLDSQTKVKPTTE
jgi:hypothetical protein